MISNDNSVQNWNIENYEDVDSTQKIAMDLIHSEKVEFIKHGTVICANGQLDGIGRSNNKWYAAPEDIAVTIILRYNAIKNFSQISYVAAVALLKTFQELFKLNSISVDQYKIECKWPNDILVDGKKISGILIKNVQIKTNFGFLLIGIGINVVYKAILDEVNGVSLDRFGIKIKKDVLLSILLKNIKNEYNEWLTSGFDHLRALWLKNAYKLNHEIKLTLEGRNLSGRFIDIDNDGTLILADCENSSVIKHRVYTSEIWS